MRPCSRWTVAPGPPRSWRSRSVVGPCRPERRGSGRSTPRRRPAWWRRRGRSWAGSPRPPAGPRSTRRPRPARRPHSTPEMNIPPFSSRVDGRREGPRLVGGSGVVELGLVGGAGPAGDPPVALGELLPRAAGQARGCGRCRRRRAGRWAGRRAPCCGTARRRCASTRRAATRRRGRRRARPAPGPAARRPPARPASRWCAARGAGGRACSCTQLHDPLDVGQAAVAELEVRLAVAAARQPLGLHPGLEGADLAHLAVVEARRRASGSARSARGSARRARGRRRPARRAAGPAPPRPATSGS